MNAIADELAAAFPGVTTEEAYGDKRILAGTDIILDVLEAARQKGFTLFVDLGGVDYLEKRTPRFDLVYILRNPETADALTIRVGIEDGQHVPTGSEVFKGINWAEREIYDLFGIVFDGHPNLTRILLPDGWEGHPLRRDYPLVGTEPSPPLATD